MSDLAIPMFIGMVIDKVNKDDYDAVGELCLYMIIVVVVSILVSCVMNSSYFHTFTFIPVLTYNALVLGFCYLRRFESR